VNWEFPTWGVAAGSIFPDMDIWCQSSCKHWGRGVLETGDYIASTFRSLAHCTQNVLDDNIWNILTDETAMCTQ